MKEVPDFQNEPLSDMVAVGRVDTSSARLWLRAGRPGTVKITCLPEEGGGPQAEVTLAIPADNARDNTVSVRVPEAGPGLAPLTRYRFEATRPDDGRRIGAGRFQTAPASASHTPVRFSFALMSCHQPFNGDGSLNRKSLKMLRAVRRCLAQHDVKYILMMGDQLYTDNPRPLSLFDADYFRRLAPAGRSRIEECSADEVRRIFQDRYRLFWNVPEWRAIHQEYPCYPILDDHDLVDNWGSDPAHQTARWQAFGLGARAAYLDYQGSRIVDGRELPESFHYSFTYGHTATFVMDLRSQRTAGESGRLYAPSQFRDLEDFLELHADKRIVFLVLSVPAIHLPKAITKLAARMTHAGEDFSDRWSTGSHIRDRDRLFRLIHDHQMRRPDRKIVLLSGDIHLGCAQKIQWGDGTAPFYQLISSGITHSLGHTMQIAAKLLMRLNRNFSTRDGTLAGNVDFLQGKGHFTRNPYGGMNVGIVEVENDAGESGPHLRFSLYGHRGERPFREFRSVAF